MAENVPCPSCKADETKRLNEVLRQQALEGVKNGLAEQYAPPRQPWGYVQGFLLALPINVGLMFSIGPPGESEGDKAIFDILSTVAFLGVWVGYGAWKNKTYTKKLDEWKSAIAAKLHCLKCGHVFEG
jgi:Zn ribbon nucleic-acid-binding protein